MHKFGNLPIKVPTDAYTAWRDLEGVFRRVLDKMPEAVELVLQVLEIGMR